MNHYIMNVKRSLLLVLFALCILSVCCCLGLNNIAYASSQNNQAELELICKDYTEDEFLYGEEKIDSNKISLYENYVNNRFDINNCYNTNANIEDDWILKIVPEILFIQKVEDFLYIGKKYGFYVDYNSIEDNYLIYFVLHKECDNISGQYARRIQPLYYERYKYNASTGNVSLIYKTDGSLHYYEKYSNVKKLYLKNVSFTGRLYNENHLNDYEEGYAANNDYGGYFFGNYYKFKGVSTQSGKTDFNADVFKTLIGYVPLPGGYIIGDAINIADLLVSLVQFGTDVTNDFRGEVTNENNYGIEFDEGFAQEQICRYGHLSKDGGAILETDNTKDSVMFGIRDSCYIQNTFFIGYRNQDNRWNTRFSGQITLDIVEETGTQTGSVVRNIATKVKSTDYIKSFDNGEKTELDEGDEQSIYILADTKHNIMFEAPVKGTYTVKTSGNTANDFLTDKGVKTDLDDGVNKKMVVDLQKDEVFHFSVIKNDWNSANLLDIIIEFTPDEIIIGQTKQIEIKPGKYEYLLFRADHKATPFEFEINAEEDISLQFAYNKYDNYMPNSISGNNLYGSRLAEYEGKYYLIISNTSDSLQTVTIAFDEVRSVIPNAQINEEILDGKVYEFSSNFSSSVEISVDSEAPILMQVFDAEHNLLAWTSNVAEKQMICSVESGDKYYVVLKNLLYTTYNMDLLFNFNPYELNIGNNNVVKNSDGLLMKFSTGKTEAAYKVQGDIGFVIYDDEWNAVNSSTSDEFQLEANKMYYIYANGAVQKFKLNINIVSTDDKSGNISASGMVLIKYIPTRTSAYKVTGMDSFEWYNSTLQKHNAYLYKSETYYLKIEGSPNSTYSVNITRNTSQIQPNSSLTIGSGMYYFNITDAGTYTIWVTCSIGVTTTLTITNDAENIIIDNLQLANESFEIYFEAGLYYLDFNVFNGDKASFRINFKE